MLLLLFNQGAGDDFASKLLNHRCFSWHYIDISYPKSGRIAESNIQY